MESSQSTESFECENQSSDDDGCDVYHDVEHEQTIRNLSVSIAGLKRVLCDADAGDADTQDEDIVIIPEKKSLTQSVVANSATSAGRSILSFFKKPVQSGRINNDEFDDTQNVAPAVVPVIPSERRNIRNSSEILGTVGASGQEKRATSKNEGQGTRDYSKNKRVCLLCAKSDDTKLKNRAILSRGGDYQINRHKNSTHPSIPLAEVKSNIVPINHISVPKSVRAKSCIVPAKPPPARNPDAEVTTGNDKSSSDDDIEEDDNNDNHKIETMATSNLQNNKTVNSQSQRTESSGRCSAITADTTLQTNLSNFVTVTKQTFEEKVISMIEKLSIKVDNLKEASSTTAGNIESHHRCGRFELVGVTIYN
jgi:hypothetical protein